MASPMHNSRLLLSTFRLAATVTLLATAALAFADDFPWRLQDALNAPGWLIVEGDYRARYESLNNTYRILDPGSDDLVASRVHLHVRADGEQFYAGLELQDSRAWLDDTFTPVGTDDVNVLEPIRAYIGYRSGNVDVQLGRMTMDVGSRRMIARNRFRNTTNVFTGINAIWTNPAPLRYRHS